MTLVYMLCSFTLSSCAFIVLYKNVQNVTIYALDAAEKTNFPAVCQETLHFKDEYFVGAMIWDSWLCFGSYFS